MKVCAVVSEFNPFHNGHKYLLDKIRQQGYDAVVCVMSGNFVQRGEYAVCDKKIRAKMAVDCGADLVVSIPFPWSCASAEHFSLAAVSILKSLGVVDAIAFGSECGNLIPLQRCSEFLAGLTSEKIRERQKIAPELSYAQVRQNIVKEELGEKAAMLLSSPNDILAIEYIKAIIRLDAKFDAIPIKRTSASHSGSVISDTVCSSSYIREFISQKDISKIGEYVPWNVEILSENQITVDKCTLFNFIRGAVLSREPEELSGFAENGGGLEYAIYREMLVAKDYDSLLSSLGSRHLTDAKIRRALLFTALGVKKEAILENPEFTELLCCSDKGKELLAICRKMSTITVLSKTANIKNASDKAKRQFKLQRKSEIAFETLIRYKEQQGKL
ncbi:MAG: nucleotidyltransferase family protein [Clostridia bacterium]|nr:nucleotidyltransferase family protein [Clostridia bacterium]